MLLARQGMHSANIAAHARRGLTCQASSSARLAVVGDVHNQWGQRDAAALKALDADLALFVGDFGNENVQLVQQIANLDVPKAAILGNHDAWYTMTARPRSRSRSPPPSTVAAGGVAAAAAASGASGGSDTHSTRQQQAAEDIPCDRVQQQLDALGNCHAGYAHMALPDKHISLVGARPFSKGGKSFRTIRNFMGRLYGVYDMGESAQRIMDVINSQVPQNNALVLMGHNGPAGLGDQRHNICGVDWVKEAGDHGDPDLQSVLQQLKELGRHVALVVFGHMHHTLRGKGKRQMVHVDSETGTVFLNAATVPRVAAVPQRGPNATPVSKHHFLVIELVDGQVHCAADVWVHVAELSGGASATPQSNTNGSSSRSSPEGLPLQTSALVGTNRNGNSTDQGSRQAAVRQQGSSSSSNMPQMQLLINQQQRSIDGFAVQVADINEVLRRSSCRVDPKQQEQQPEPARCVEYWDAFYGEWKLATVPRLSVPPPVKLNIG